MFYHAFINPPFIHSLKILIIYYIRGFGKRACFIERNTYKGEFNDWTRKVKIVIMFLAIQIEMPEVIYPVVWMEDKQKWD